MAPDVPDHLALDQVGIVAADHPALAVRQFLLVLAEQGIDGQGTHGAVVGRHTRIGVQGEGEIDRNGFSAPFGIADGAAAQLGDPGAAAGVIACVFAVPLLRHRGIDARPLHGIQGAFGEGGKSGSPVFRRVFVGTAAGDLAHPAADLDGVRTHDTAPDEIASFRCPVVQDDGAVAFKLEGPEVDPGSAAPFLVDDEPGLPAEMADGIVGALTAVVLAPIGDIDGVGAALGHAEGPGGAGGRFLAADAAARRTGAEGILVQHVDRRRIGESGPGFFPFALFVV